MALDHGLSVSVGGEDFSRADPDFLLRVLDAVAEAGAWRFRFADTLGVLDPFATEATFRRLRAHTTLALEFHGHDDLGLATANTLAALRGGATDASVCVLGLGERAGNAPLEQVAAAIARLGLGDTHVDLARLGALADLVARAACRSIPPAQPIVGELAFTHESGIHVSGLLRDPGTYEAIDPAMFGRQRRIVLGKHSGTAAVRDAPGDGRHRARRRRRRRPGVPPAGPCRAGQAPGDPPGTARPARRRAARAARRRVRRGATLAC